MSKTREERRLRRKNFKKASFIAGAIVLTVSGCSEASRVSYNLSQEAYNFNDIRQLTVINCCQVDVLFQMTGRM